MNVTKFSVINFSFANVLGCTYTQMHEAGSVLFWQVFYLREWNFSLNCKKIIALKIAYKIVAFFTENHPSPLKKGHKEIMKWSHGDYC